jgi:hypothetical protein
MSLQRGISSSSRRFIRTITMIPRLPRVRYMSELIKAARWEVMPRIVGLSRLRSKVTFSIRAIPVSSVFATTSDSIRSSFSGAWRDRRLHTMRLSRRVVESSTTTGETTFTSVAKDDSRGLVRLRFPRNLPSDYAYASLKGRLRARFPVAAKTAEATAGAIPGRPSSPIPVGGSWLGSA